MSTNQKSAREIAERIINNPHDIGGSIDLYRASESVARAYLELADSIYFWRGQSDEAKFELKSTKQHLINAENEVDKLKKDNAYLYERLEEFKEELERLKK